MGKYLLLICAGLVVIFGMIEVNVQSRQKGLIQRSAKASYSAQARNMANEATDIVMQKLESYPAWRNNYQPWTVNLDNGIDSVRIIDYTMDSNLNYRQLKIVSKAVLSTETATVITNIQEKGGLPPVPSAMGFYSDTVSFNANGSSFVINGNDTKIDGTTGYGQPLPGISVPGQNAYNTIYNAMNKNQTNKVTGVGGTTPNIKVDPSLNPTNLENHVQQFLNQADTTYYAGSYSGTKFGTASHPQITVVDGNIKVSGTSGGYGIMIVQNASQLDFTGDFHFNGLIIMQGGMFQSSGNIYINGSLQFGKTQSTEFYGASVSGNVNINYSTQAFQTVEGGMGKRLNIRYVKTGTYE